MTTACLKASCLDIPKLRNVLSYYLEGENMELKTYQKKVMMGKLFCTVLPDMNRFAADIFQQLNRRVRISLMTYVRGVRIWSSAIRSSTRLLV